MTNKKIVAINNSTYSNTPPVMYDPIVDLIGNSQVTAESSNVPLESLSHGLDGASGVANTTTTDVVSPADAKLASEAAPTATSVNTTNSTSIPKVGGSYVVSTVINRVRQAIAPSTKTIPTYSDVVLPPTNWATGSPQFNSNGVPIGVTSSPSANLNTVPAPVSSTPSSSSPVVQNTRGFSSGSSLGSSPQFVNALNNLNNGITAPSSSFPVSNGSSSTAVSVTANGSTTSIPSTTTVTTSSTTTTIPYGTSGINPFGSYKLGG